MALVEQDLQTGIERVIYECADKQYNGNADRKTKEFARRLASLLTDYIKTATVTIQAGQTVTGTAVSGAVTGTTVTPGTGSLS